MSFCWLRFVRNFKTISFDVSENEEVRVSLMYHSYLFRVYVKYLFYLYRRLIDQKSLGIFLEIPNKRVKNVGIVFKETPSPFAVTSIHKKGHSTFSKHQITHEWQCSKRPYLKAHTFVSALLYHHELPKFNAGAPRNMALHGFMVPLYTYFPSFIIRFGSTVAVFHVITPFLSYFSVQPSQRLSCHSRKLQQGCQIKTARKTLLLCFSS